MLKIFYRNNGAISVFLTLILIPVLLVGGLTVDASRIYMSKVVISDAGEMTMNAALAQYNEKLHDEYGLLVMDRSPESMGKELEKYFNGSLNGTGLPGTEDYKRILDLLTKNFQALNVQGSEIYQTEVEKQQILEYMKYRAPICLAEILAEKLNLLKDTRKMTETMEAEMEFSEAMEDCQDAFREAKEALDTLDSAIKSFPSPEEIRKEMSDTEKDYKEIAARCLLMYSAIQRYDERSGESDCRKAAEQFIDSAEKVDLSTPYQFRTFNQYINSLNAKNAVEALGGIDRLTDGGRAAQTEAGQTENGDASEEDSGDADREELEELVRKYKEQNSRIEGYPDRLLAAAKDVTDSHSNTLKAYLNTAGAAQSAAKTAYGKLNEVKKKLEKASSKFKIWDQKYGELEKTGKAGEMGEEIKEYEEFFTTGTGSSDMEALKKLMSDVKEDKDCFGEWKKILKKEKFFGKSIAETDSAEQIRKYRSQADAAVSKTEAQYIQYSTLERIRGEYIQKYEHHDPANPYDVIPISDDLFYRRLQEYCRAEQETDSQEEQDQANDSLNKSKTAGEDAGKEEEYPAFNWGSLSESMTLPSARLKSQKTEADGKLTDLDAAGNVKDKQARRDVISKFKESIKAANSFLEAAERILEDGLENLYIAEYAMQMFSYYTVEMQDGQHKADSEVISISGYSLKEHKAYRAECEYILWGKQESRKNVRNTVMMIFGIRLLFNSIFAFTDKTINATANGMASAITAAAPYLMPVVNVVIKLGFAGLETADDISRLKEGYEVAILKDSSTWTTLPIPGGNKKKPVTFGYADYLRIFLNVSMMTGHEADILGRIADCIQVNTPDLDLLTGYTMLCVQAEVSSRTTFMRKIADEGKDLTWGFPDDCVTISYQSILGY